MAALYRFSFSFHFYLTLVLLIVSLLVNYSSQDILGCGGFLKSQVSLDFSKVEIKLYTKQGTLKESSDCAPTNGYYFIPLYDKGEYLLKIEPPPGWSFEPKEVHLNFDGLNDPCSKLNDINFVFKGFTISGKVISSGTTEGPKNVIVNLNSESNEPTKYSTVTGKNGDFQFAFVLPNKYLITAQHEKFKFLKNSAKFTVKEGNLELPLDSLIIAGYDVTGQVLFNDEPTKGVNFVLVANQKQNQQQLHCAKKFLPGFKGEYLCVSESDENGNFHFETLPPGNYTIKPYSVKFDVYPEEASLVVKHGPVVMADKFLVKGFSMIGKVMTSASGSVVSNAEIYLNGMKVATTDKDGKYNLNSIESGTYVVSVKSENVKFEDISVKVSPNTPEIETIYGSEFKVCGLVIPASAQNPKVVEITSANDPKNVVEAGVDFDTGKFCWFLKPGNYNLKVKVSESEKSMGMQYHPLVKEIQVKNGPSSDIEFIQLRGNINGKIVKLPDTGKADVVLTVKLKSKNTLISQKTLENSLSYTFEEVLPGQYDVEVENNEWCFKNQIHSISVTSSKTTVPDFVQTGYKIEIYSSHQTSVFASSTPDENYKKEFLLDKKNNIICLPRYTSYKFIPFGCHGFEKEMYAVDLKQGRTLNLNAIAHDVTGFVKTSAAETDLGVNVNLLSGETVRLGPLKKEKDENGVVYRFSYRAKENQVLKFVPTSSKLLFDPESVEFRTTSECSINAIQFSGENGLIIEGSINPPLADVKVTLKIKGSSEKFVFTTKTDGKYVFGPLRSSVNFELTAEKESFVLSGPDQNGNFKAHKLAEIKVKVVDNSSDEPLKGVLLSLTGGEKFRKNSMTEEGGVFSFHSLSPGKYFLRPMMKEYKFEPSSQIIQIKEGITESIEIRGRRVSFSAYGSITSLNGEPEPNVVVEAVGINTCSNLQEETSSEANGIFRIRGLLPHCEYQIRLKNSPDVNVHIHRLAPSDVIIRTKDGDVRGIHLIAFQWIEQMDLSVHVESTIPEHLKTLKLKLYKEDLPDSPVYAVKLDTLAGGSKHWGNPSAQERFLKAGLLIQLPFIPRDKSSYFVQIESSLNKHTYTYKEPVVHFVADKTYKNFKILFEPSLKAMDNEFSQSNYIIVPLLIFAGLLYTSFNKAVPFIQNFFGTLNQASFSFQKDERNFYVNNINDSVSIEPVGLPTKRKSKPRKT